MNPHKKPGDRDPFIIREDKISDNDISGTIKNRWVEDSWSELTGQNLAKGSKLGFLGLAVSAKRFLGLYLIIGLLLALLFGRGLYLQVIRGDYYLARAEANRLRFKAIPAERGIIYDSQMKPLVTNVPTFSLELIPAELPKDQTQAELEIDKIAQLADVDKNEIKNTLAEFKNYDYRAITIKENLDYDSAIRLIAKSADLPELSIEKNTRRQYLANEANLVSLSHVLGYQGKVSKEDLKTGANYLPTDYIGKTGLEKSYETILRGVYGKKEIEVDALGRVKGVVAQEPPLPGTNLILALNLELQKKLEEALSRQLRAAGKKRGAAVALNPQNGEILALVSLPAYDNNLFSRSLSQDDYDKLLGDANRPLFSRAWSGEYPAGSVIKLVLAAAALNEKIITEKTSFESVGGLQVNQWFFSDWKAGGHGRTNVIKALAESVNTFFYIAGGGYKNFEGLGVEKILSYYKKFGLALVLGVDLPNEAAGFLPSPEWKQNVKQERWYIGDTYNISIGQGDVLVTPLQVAAYTTAFANGGTIYKPRLIKAWLDANRRQTNLPPVVLKKQVVPSDIIDIVRRGMRSAVTVGSARSLNDLNIKIAGKTGTAQWSKIYSPHAWFTGFAPYDDPQIVLTVLIEEGGEGSAVAVPVAKEVFDWWANR